MRTITVRIFNINCSDKKDLPNAFLWRGVVPNDYNIVDLDNYINKCIRNIYNIQCVNFDWDILKEN